MNSVKGFIIVSCAIAAGSALGGAACATPVLGVPSTSVPSPVPLATSVSITANATDTDTGTISYRFQIGGATSTALQTVRDFSTDNVLIYTPTRTEGAYQFVVTARNNTTGLTATSSVPSFHFTARVHGATPVVNLTANALVALLSSPPCPTGAINVRASVTLAGTSTTFNTNWETCRAGHNVNVLIAGMHATSTYNIVVQTWNGRKVTSGASVAVVTGTPSVTFPTLTERVPFTSGDSQAEQFLLFSTIGTNVFGADVFGNPNWYYVDSAGPALITRIVTGGKILVLANGKNSVSSAVQSSQILREIDLAGNIIRETNASRIGEQIAALSGLPNQCQIGGTDCLSDAFSHDAIELPNGHTLALVNEEKVFTDGTQGSSPSNPVDIIGDTIVDLDANYQVVGYWRSFDHMSADRAAILGETCAAPLQGGCPPLYLVTTKGQDWLHGNSLQYVPADGSLIYSARHQDWILKIDYGNGTGSYNTKWTLGKGGDFTINSTDPYPWFSHQHDPGYVQSGSTTMAIFDNGNTRVAPPPVGLGTGHSRGYVLTIDETNKIATPTLLADLGFFSMALGTAEPLANGDFHFEAGWDSTTNPPNSDAVEVTSGGVIDYEQQITGHQDYRSFRLPNLYSPPFKD